MVEGSKGPDFTSIINPLLTDYYQISMNYSYWKNNTHMNPSVFDAFFRKCPFKGEVPYIYIYIYIYSLQYSEA